MTTLCQSKRIIPKKPTCLYINNMATLIMTLILGYFSRDTSIMSRDGSFLSRDSSRDTQGYFSRESSFMSRDNASHFSREGSFMSRGTPLLSRENTAAKGGRSTLKDSLDEADESRELTPVNKMAEQPRDCSTPVKQQQQLTTPLHSCGSNSLMPATTTTTSYLIQQTSLNGNSTAAVPICGCSGCPGYQQPLAAAADGSCDDEYDCGADTTSELGYTSAAGYMAGMAGNRYNRYLVDIFIV